MFDKIKNLFSGNKTALPTVTTSPSSKRVVLLIEDEGLLSRMYAKKIEMDGFQYISASNGDDGIKMAIEQRPDLIVCDVMMPKKDGLTVLKELKTNLVTQNIPVIMLSNLADQKYVDQALETGAVSYLIKSEMLPAQVVAKIKEVLESVGKRNLVSVAA